MTCCSATLLRNCQVSGSFICKSTRSSHTLPSWTRLPYFQPKLCTVLSKAWTQTFHRGGCTRPG